jgi:Xaa-Pro dipeptidase
MAPLRRLALISRRRFLQSTSLAAAASAALPSLASAEDKPLPPSIAALKSLKDQATPISVDERRQRQEKARQLMRENNLSAILLMEGTSLNYFSGIRWWGGERMFAMILPTKGESFYVCPAFEEGRAREQIAKSPDAANPDVRIWQEDESPYERVAQGLKDLGIAAGTIGVEETVRFVFSDTLRKAAATATFTSATPVTAGCRMIKSAHEIELMRLASNATLAAYEATYHAIKPGMSQYDVADLVAKAHRQQGFEGDFALVLLGEYSAFPHGSVTPQQIHEGTIILIDSGCNVEGYVSDMTRTFVMGKPTDKMKQVFDIVHRAQSAAVAAAKPGAECGSVDAAARKVISDAGYGPDYKYFTHRLGHGMGMDGHEWPYLVRGNRTKLESNITTSNEPGIYIRGEFGVRLEDDMHVTENGAALFTPQSASLENPFGSS